MIRFIKKLAGLLPSRRANGAASAAAVDADDPYWQEVYSARQAYYEKHVGPVPDEILKMMNLFGVWPGGGLLVVPASKIRPGLWAYSSFGLSNPDMPATVSSRHESAERDEQGRVTQQTSVLTAKQPVDAPAGSAGYGYEFIIYADENAEWPLWLLQWAVNAEILEDVGFLNRVEQHKGLTVEDLRISEDKTAHILIAKARPPLAAGTMLPNGTMEMLVATVITDEEMHWSMEHGRDALLARLSAVGVGQISSLNRPSVVSRAG